MQKSENFHTFTIDSTWKTSFWAIYGQFPFKSISRLYVSVTACKKKSKNFHALILHKTWKTLISAYFGVFLPKNPKTRFFSNNRALSFFKLDDRKWQKDDRFVQKVRKSLQTFPKKNSGQTDKQTNRLRMLFYGSKELVVETIVKRYLNIGM